MIGNIETIRNDKDESIIKPSQEQKDSSSNYDIPLVNEKEFDEIDQTKNTQGQPVVLRHMSNVYSATDTCQFSYSESSINE